MRKAAAIVGTLVVLTGCLSRLRAQQPEPLLANGGFEGGSHRATIFWTPGGGPYKDYEFGEIDGPNGWIPWWLEGFDCSGTPDWQTGRPEVKVITAVPDAERVRSGEQAVQWFTFWRCHTGGLLQQVGVEEGRYYAFSVYAHAWFANCDSRPHDAPYDYDCVTPIDWAQDRLSVGIDPTGSIDPRAPSVVWGTAQEIYGVYSDRLTTGRVQAQGPTMTVFVESEASRPLKHCDFYIDDAVLRDVTHQMFLPSIIRTRLELH